MVRTHLKRPVMGLCITPILVCLLMVCSGSTVVLAQPNASFSFKTFELSATTGVTCPNSAKTCTNTAAEPAIRADKSGNFYASSENGLGSGTDAWKSTTAGKTYTALASPDAASQTLSPGFAPGGGDTDLAVATTKNA